MDNSNDKECVNSVDGDNKPLLSLTITGIDPNLTNLKTNKYLHYTVRQHKHILNTITPRILTKIYTATTSAMLYENSRLAHEDKFKVGSSVTVMVAEDTRIGKIQLGNSTFNLEAIFGTATASAPVATKAKEEAVEAEA